MMRLLALPVLLLALALAGCGTSTVDTAADTTSTDPAADPWAGQATGATARFDLAGADWHAMA